MVPQISQDHIKESPMNEQIKLLAEQAGIGYYNLSTGNGDNWRLGGTPEELKKFAELIIKECANVALREDHDPHECILSHFGVKDG
jgi:hypothetical protein